jgi:putative membrane protein
MNLTEQDHARISAAVTRAEDRSDGEIVTIISRLSDSYHDVALHWAVLVLVAVLAWAAASPDWLSWWYTTLSGGWRPSPTLRELLTFLMILAVLKFTVSLLILRWMPLRLALTPRATKHRRVRTRAIALFKAAAEHRTVGRTGILIYLSEREQRAEIVADEAILAVTDEATWGEAMNALLAEVREGRVADGMVAAIERIGNVLAEHFPKTIEDRNEISDRLIEL